MALFRNRLYILLLGLVSVCIYFYLISTPSTPKQFDEIWGLLSLVTRDSEKSQYILASDGLDANHPLDSSFYAPSRFTKWEKEQYRLDQEYPVVVFSKTYCPHSRKAKQLLELYQLSPPPKIIEVDLREDGPQLKAILTRLTRHSTFPNVIIKGKSIGGSDDLHALHNANALRNLLEDAGITVNGNP